MVKNKVGEYCYLSSTTQIQTSENHNFGVYTDKSPKICAHVKQLFLYKAGLLLNINISVPFLKVKALPKAVFLSRVAAGLVRPSNRKPPLILIDSPPYPTLGSRRGWLSECSS